MKKQYISPKLKTLKINPSAMICLSFGDGETDIMYSKQRDGGLDEEDNLWEE